MEKQASSKSSFNVLYQAPGLSPVRMLNIVALSFTVGGLGLAAFLTMAPPPIMFSDLSRGTWAAGMALLAIASPIASWMYGRRIASRVLLSADGRTLRVCEAGFLHTTQRDIQLSDIVLESITMGDAAGEERLAPSRLEVNVRGQRSFVVPFNRGVRSQRDRLVQALQSG